MSLRIKVQTFFVFSLIVNDVSRLKSAAFLVLFHI